MKCILVNYFLKLVIFREAKNEGKNGKKGYFSTVNSEQNQIKKLVNL